MYINRFKKFVDKNFYVLYKNKKIKYITNNYYYELFKNIYDIRFLYLYAYYMYYLILNNKNVICICDNHYIRNIIIFFLYKLNIKKYTDIDKKISSFKINGVLRIMKQSDYFDIYKSDIIIPICNEKKLDLTVMNGYFITDIKDYKKLYKLQILTDRIQEDHFKEFFMYESFLKELK